MDNVSLHLMNTVFTPFLKGTLHMLDMLVTFYANIQWFDCSILPVCTNQGTAF